MKRRLLAAATTIVVAAAVYLVSTPTPPPAAVPTAPAVPRPARPTDAGSPIADAVQRVLSPPPEPETLRRTPVVGRADAEANFESLMQSLEGMADRHDRLSRPRRDELYRNINDAFSGLSATLESSNAQDMQLLEDANIRMKAMMQELGIRVPLRPPQGAP